MWDFKIESEPKTLSHRLIYGIIDCPHIIVANLSSWLGLENLVFANSRGHFFEINKSPSNIVYGVLLLFDLFCQHFNSELPWPPLLCEVFHSCQACNLVFRCQTCGSVPRYQAFSHNGLVLASELVASFILEVAQVQPFLSSCLLASIQLYHNMSANLMGCRSAFPRVFLWVLA
jgi:hypothetical protein